MLHKLGRAILGIFLVSVACAQDTKDRITPRLLSVAATIRNYTLSELSSRREKIQRDLGSLSRSPRKERLVKEQKLKQQLREVEEAIGQVKAGTRIPNTTLDLDEMALGRSGQDKLAQ